MADDQYMTIALGYKINRKIWHFITPVQSDFRKT